jgi:hypothetical protein
MKMGINLREGKGEPMDEKACMLNRDETSDTVKAVNLSDY